MVMTTQLNDEERENETAMVRKQRGPVLRIFRAAIEEEDEEAGERRKAAKHVQGAWEVSEKSYCWAGPERK